jgi:hypothetical protein
MPEDTSAIRQREVERAVAEEVFHKASNDVERSDASSTGRLARGHVGARRAVDFPA